MAALALVACGGPAVETVARLDNVILTRQDLDQRITRIEEGLKEAPPQGQQPTRAQIEESLVERFIDQNLILSLARKGNIAVQDKEIDDLISEFRTRIEQSGSSTLDKAVKGQLGFSGADSTEFRQFVSSILAQQKLSQTLVTTDTVRQQVTEQVMAAAGEQVEKATVAHILVETEDEAKQVIARLDKGEKFEDLAKELSKDPGSAQNGGVYEGIQRGQFVPEFDKAMFEDLKPGETTKEPVKTQFGFHIIRLIDRVQGPAMTPEEAQQQIEQTIPQQLADERQQAFEKLLEEERTKAQTEGRLQKPTYPTPAPALIPGQPEQPQTTPTS